MADKDDTPEPEGRNRPAMDPAKLRRIMDLPGPRKKPDVDADFPNSRYGKPPKNYPRDKNDSGAWVYRAKGGRVARGMGSAKRGGKYK